MSGHPDEILLTAYVDDALQGGSKAELEAHLVGCRECRTRVVALRDESAFLANVLNERLSSAPVRESPPETEADVAVGVPLAIAAATIVFGVVGALLETRMPGGFDFLNPLRLKGAYEMVFDFVFFLRDNAPGLVELLLALGAVASVSALLSFGVGLLYRRIFGAATGVLFALVLLGAPAARAVLLEVDEESHVARGEVVSQSMVVTGDRARIDGIVEGDVVASVERMQITGRVEGNLYVFTRDLDISGSVGGTVHTVSERARIDGRVEGGLLALTEYFTLTPEGSVERDAWLLLNRGELYGRFGRDVLVGGDDIEVGGRIERNLDMRFVENVRLQAGARIGGDVDAWISEDDQLERDEAFEVAGELRIHEGEEPGREALLDRIRLRIALFHAVGFVASLVFALLAYAFFPRLFDVGIPTAQDFFRQLLMGLVLLVVPPVAIVLVGLTLVGLPIAVLSAFVYITAVYGAEILVATWLGRTVMGREQEASVWSFGRVFFVGAAILAVVTLLPFVGPPIAILCLLVGLGLLYDRARRLPFFAR